MSVGIESSLEAGKGTKTNSISSAFYLGPIDSALSVTKTFRAKTSVLVYHAVALWR